MEYSNLLHKENRRPLRLIIVFGSLVAITIFLASSTSSVWASHEPSAESSAPAQVASPSDAPACDVAGHDVTRMHSHYDVELDCWHDHSHMSPDEPLPSQQFIALNGGQSLSYPWLTGDGAENLPWPNGKHEGYNFESGNTSTRWTCVNPPDCIDTYEIEWHGIPVNKGMATRFHSFSALLRIDDGFIFYGGWMDCGQDVTIDDTQTVTIDTSRPQPTGTALKHTQVRNRSQTWYCQLPDTDIENLIGQQYGMQIGQTTVENIFDPLDPLCGPDAERCRDRGQSMYISEILFDLDRGWLGYLDPDGNGYVDYYRTFVDRYGNRRLPLECSTMGLDCIPFIIRNVPVARYHMITQAGIVTPRYITTDASTLNWWNRE
ncbi:MAG: hypothetical protein M9928_12410 [Anaerolineae bacterium]|nr:hypothetical protein [Anaerolineae bacterium]MCO5205830.1 hypothetical protein [Anaerolineae bacterium]